MRGSSHFGRVWLIVGVLVWVVSSSGWAALGPKKAPNEARLREAETLTEEYERLSAEGQYPEAAEVAGRACSILEEEQGKPSIELAGCLNDLGVFVRKQGDKGKAEPLLERALAILEKASGPEHPDVATSLNNLALLYQDQGEYGKAEPLYERALRRSSHVGRVGLLFGVLVWVASSSGWAALGPKKAPDDARLREAEALTEEYDRFYGEGQYLEAAEVAARACSILEEEHGKSSIQLARCLNDLGAIGVDRGEYGKAEPLFRRALAIREKALDPSHADVAESLNNLASIHLYQGDYGKAEPLLERALAIQERALGPAHPDVALSLHNLAGLHHTQGDYGKAEPLYERAIAIWEKVSDPEHPFVATGLSNLGLLYQAQGDYGNAESLYERALAVSEETLGPEHPDVATRLNNRATLYQDQGDYGNAESLHERALAIWEKAVGPEHPRVATTLNNLALVYDDQGDYGKAEPLYERALAIWERALGPDHPDVATSLNNLASFYKYQGDYGKAEPRFERALAIWEKAFGPDHPKVAYGLNNLAVLYRDRGEYKKAELKLGRALAIRKKTLGSDHALVAASFDNLALLYEDQADFDCALMLRRRALDIEEANLVRTLTIANESRRLAFASMLLGSLHHTLSLHLRVVPEHDAIAELALTTLLRRKNRVQDLVSQANAALRRSLSHDDLHLLDDLADVDSRLAVLSNRGPGPRGVEVHAQRLDEIDERRDRLWGKLAKHSALVESLEHPVTIRDVQTALPVDGALIEFVQYAPQHDEAGARLRKHELKPPPRYAAYLIFPDRDFAWVDLGLAAPIDEHVEAFRKALQTKQAIPTELYDAVMRPIIAKLGSSTHHLVLASAGALSLIPFGALFDGHHYLVEQYDLHYVTTGRDLLPPPAVPPVATTPVTIVANPTGDEVPGAELEADVLAGLFPKAHVLRGDEATETNVRAIERPLVLHLATHGFFGVARNERDNPMFRSGLNLADIAKVEVDPDLDDGQLTAYEVSGMDLRGTQLVVLSACGTGLGEVDSSEGVFGLRRAFATADAQTTVMSLWEVSGTTTQQLMEAYYLKLAEGMGRGEAMQAVQLEMLRSEEHRHPKDWAAFIVSGDDSPMVFPAGEEPRMLDPGPPEIEPRNRKGLRCAVGKSSDCPRSNLMMLMGLLGLVAIRRRAQLALL